MIRKIQRATASSPGRARGDYIKGVLACALQNVSFMLPTGLLYLLVERSDGRALTAGRTRVLCDWAASCCFALILSDDVVPV